jgi:hypothetical protein
MNLRRPNVDDSDVEGFARPRAAEGQQTQGIETDRPYANQTLKGTNGA